MLARTTMAARAAARGFSTSTPAATRVAVLGAAGGIGQPLSLLLKMNDSISHLALFDLHNTPGVAADLSHINTKPKVSGHKGPAELGAALTGAEIVVIPAGVPRKPNQSRDDLFNTNASIVATLVDGVAKHCPGAHVLIISNPINSTVPIAAEVLKRRNAFDPKRLFGVTTLDVLRANTFVAESQKWDPTHTDVTVVGGHAGITILPLLSQVTGAKFSKEQVEALTHRIQFGGDEVVKAKDGAGSATLSMAAAADRFVSSLLRAVGGAASVSECAYVQSPIVPGVPFFSTRIELGKGGVTRIHPIGAMSDFEKAALDKMVPELKASVEKGVKFAQAWKPAE